MVPRRLAHDMVFRVNNSDRKNTSNQNGVGKVNNKIGDNETVEHTSPEMKKVCNLIKNNSTPSSGE